MNRAWPRLPNSWRWAVSGEVIDVRDGTHDSPAYQADGIPLVTSKNLKPEGIAFENIGHISTQDHLAISKRSKVDRNDILFAMIGTIGNPVIVEGDCEFSIKNVALFKCGDGQVDPRYFLHLLGSQVVRNQLDEATRGGTQKFVSLTVLRGLQIPLPPLAEQRRIAEVLDRAEGLRAKRRAAIAQLDSLTQSLFLDLFGDPATNPKGWPMKELGDVATEVYRYPTYYDITYEDDGVPEIRGELLNADGSIVADRARLRFITARTSACFPKTMLATGDLVMSVRGTIGKIAIVPPELAGGQITANLIRIALDQTLIEPLFAWNVTQTSFFKRQITNACSSTTILTIKAPDLKRLPFPLPPIELQREFARRATAVERLKTAHRGSLAELDALFATLQHRAFRDEL